VLQLLAIAMIIDGTIYPNEKKLLKKALKRAGIHPCT
jgi:hypothetical protein